MPTLTEMLAAHRAATEPPAPAKPPPPTPPKPASTLLSVRIGLQASDCKKLDLAQAFLAEDDGAGAAPGLRAKYARAAIQPGDELLRILGLESRPRPTDDSFASYVDKWNTRLRSGPVPTPEAPCPRGCVAKYGFCISSLNELQAWGLEEFSTIGGLIAKMAVGSGKTGLDVLLAMAREDVKVAILLLKPALVDQFLNQDFPQWGEHFKVPNLDSRYARTTYPGRPTLYVYSYSDLSSPKQSALLKELKPDLILADECQNLANETAARTKRFIRFFVQAAQQDGLGPGTPPKEVRYMAASGSMQTKTIMQSGHHFALALKERSPLPVDSSTRKSWAKALDPTPVDHMATPMGALQVFCKPGENDVVGAIGRRVNEALGVISSDQSSVDVPLYLKVRKAPPVPAELAEMMAKTRAKGGTRPDGEEPKTAFDKPKWLRQMASGFYYHWRFPGGEDEELISLWFGRRADWHKEIRDRLEFATENLDSPTLLEHAAERYYRPGGYTGKLPTWAAGTYQKWMEIRHKVSPVEGCQWLDDYLLNDAVAWAEERRAAGEGGAIWCEFGEFGRRLSARLKVPYYNGGDENAASLRQEKGDRVIVCSIKGHSTGSNLQKYTRHLVCSNPADAGAWEQLLGRSHRYRQTKPVTYEVYRHTPELRSALDKAIERAEWLERFEKSPQKLIFAEKEW